MANRPYPRPGRGTESGLRRWGVRILALLGVLTLSYALGFVWFLGQIPRTVADRASVTDAIVILTGGSLRIETGIRLLREGLARQVLVSGVNRDVTLKDVADLALVPRDAIDCCVILGYAADDTVGNARETADWAAANRIRSVRLVTAGYHMPRSLIELRDEAPHLLIVPHPVFPPGGTLEDLLHRRSAVLLYLGEYHKFAGAVLRRAVLAQIAWF